MFVVLKVGLGLREQLLNAGEVPIDDRDWKMDVLITPDETLGSVGGEDGAGVGSGSSTS